MPFVLALDQGTTSSRAMVFDRGGAIRGSAQREFEPRYPRPGWVEHDPEEIWATQTGVIADALQRAGAGPGEVAAIGIANQRETTLVWDRTSGEPVHPAIVWQDRRTSAMCDRLRADGLEPLYRDRTGLVLDPYFSGTKLAWILENVAGARERAEAGELAFGTVDSWLLWRLTEGRVHATDATNASRTLLFDLGRGDWDEALLEPLGVPRAMLPQVRPTSGVFGEASAASPVAGVPIAAMVGDQQGALFGQLCTAPGLAKNTYGTGCFLLTPIGTSARRSEHRLLTTVAWRRSGTTEYAFEGSVFVGGAVVQWLRDGLGLIRRSEDVEALAASVPDSGGVFLVPAFVGLGAPHWDPYARGAIVGITRGTSAGHLARAALEGIAFQVADLLDAMRRDAGGEIRELRVDGGAARDDTLLRFQADVLGMPVVRPGVVETTALGAAYMAGLATGYWRDVAELRGNWKAERTFEPTLAPEAAARLRERWSDAVERARGWARREEDGA